MVICCRNFVKPKQEFCGENSRYTGRGKDKEEQMAGNKEKEQTPSIEETFAKLEEVIQRLEGGETSLEEAFAAYSDGMRLIKECNAQIDKVEKQVLKLTEEGSLEPLDAGAAIY